MGRSLVVRPIAGVFVLCGWLWVRALRKKGGLIREIMQEVGASKATVYRALRDA